MTRKLLPNAWPKPDPKPEKPWSRSSIKEPSYKEKIALLRAQPPRKAIAKKKRTTSEFARIYGSRRRVEWMKRQRCVVCDELASDIENVHTVGGGAGRKASYVFIVPMRAGYHRELHQVGIRTFEREYHIDLELEADRTHSRWEDFAETLAGNGHRGRR